MTQRATTAFQGHERWALVGERDSMPFSSFDQVNDEASLVADQVVGGNSAHIVDIEDNSPIAKGRLKFIWLL